MSNVDPGKWWVIFRSLDSSFKKGSFAWKEAVLAQSHNLDVQSFSKCAYPTWNLSLLEKLRAESWISCLSGLEHPFFFGNLQNTGMPMVETQRHPIKCQTQAYPLRSLRRGKESHLCPRYNAKENLLRYNRPIICICPGVRISSCWHITFFTTKSLNYIIDPQPGST